MTKNQTLASNRLRLVLRANATTSAAGGAIALVAASWVSRELGIDHVVLTRVLGAGLVLFALQVLMISRASEPRLLTESLFVSAGDAAWVIGSIVVILTGVLSSTGNLVIGLVALGVADFGATQLWFRSKAVDSSPTLERVAA